MTAQPHEQNREGGSRSAEAGVEGGRLSADIELLLGLSKGRVMSLSELEENLHGRGFALMIFVLALPFAIPALPGLSTPFGVVVALMGLRLACGRQPSLPGFIRKRELNPVMLEKILRGGLALSRRLERLVRPRLEFLQEWPGFRNLIGVGIAVAGLLLALPLPLPFSNTIPAVAVLLLTGGMVERDGVLVLIGYATNVIATAYVLLAGEGVRRIFDHWNWLG